MKYCVHGRLRIRNGQSEYPEPTPNIENLNIIFNLYLEGLIKHTNIKYFNEKKLVSFFFTFLILF